MAREFKLDAVITGGREADQVAADLKARNARVIYSLNYPVRSRALPPDADEPVSALRTRAQAPRVPAALAKAGITFAFSSDGLREPNELVRNVARAVKDGLAPDAALRALTIDAAKIAGVSDRLGSLGARQDRRRRRDQRRSVRGKDEDHPRVRRRPDGDARRHAAARATRPVRAIGGTSNRPRREDFSTGLRRRSAGDHVREGGADPKAGTTKGW